MGNCLRRLPKSSRRAGSGPSSRGSRAGLRHSAEVSPGVGDAWRRALGAEAASVGKFAPCRTPNRRSSTPTPTRRRCWRRTRSCRSSRRTPATAGVPVETRDISLAGRIIAQFPEHLTAGPAHRRRARRAGRAGRRARGEHHQAAEHQRLDPAAEGGDRRAAGAGLRPARLPRRPEDRRGAGRPGALRQGQGQRRQPGAARGQLRPPRARRRSSSTPARTRTRWARGRRTRRPTSRT